MDMAGSILANRRVINTSFLALNEKKYKYDGNECSFVWALDWWDTVEKIHRLLLPTRVQSLAIARFEDDTCSLAEGVEIILPILQALPDQIKSFAPGEVKASLATVRDREELFSPPQSSLSQPP